MNNKDIQMLNESYSLQLLKESFPQTNLEQVLENYDRYTPAEQEWIGKFSENVIEELFGGVSGIGSALSKGVGGALKNAASKVGQGVKGVGQGIAGAAKQVGQNTKNIYNTAEDQKKYSKNSEKAKKAVDMLTALIKQAKDEGFVSFKGDPMKMSLGKLMDHLVMAAQGAGDVADMTQKRGVFKGAGKAFGQGLNQ